MGEERKRYKRILRMNLHIIKITTRRSKNSTLIILARVGRNGTLMTDIVELVVVENKKEKELESIIGEIQGIRRRKRVKGRSKKVLKNM